LVAFLFKQSKMSFLYPFFLIAFLTIGIPLAIHLFNLRRHKVLYFSDIRFLKELQSKTKASSQLKHLLVLLLRILAVAALVLVFAQPYISNKSNFTNNQILPVAIYIDNSFSMESENEKGVLLQIAKNRAYQIINAYPENTSFVLLTNNFESKHLHILRRNQIIDFIEEITLTPQVKKISDILLRTKEFFNNENRGEVYRVYLLTDLQKSSFDVDNIEEDTTYTTTIIPVISNRSSNLVLDSCWFENPFRIFKQSETIFVKVSNLSAESYENISVKLFLNDSAKAVTTVNIPANQSVIAEVHYSNYSSGQVNGRLEISDFPIIFDNTLFFSYEILPEINIAIINGAKSSAYIAKLYSNEKYFKLREYQIGNVNVSEIKNANLVILNQVETLSSGLIQELRQNVEQGQNLLVIPDFGSDIISYNNLLTLFNHSTIKAVDTTDTKIIHISTEHHIYKNAFKKYPENADLPKITKRFVFSAIANANYEILLQVIDKTAVLSYSDVGRGQLYVSAIPFSEQSGNFYQHPLFVPTLFNIANFSKKSYELYYVINQRNIITIPFVNINKMQIRVHNKNTGVDFIPQVVSGGIAGEQFVVINSEINKSGIYTIQENNILLKSAAFNYNRQESNTSAYTPELLAGKIELLGLQNFEINEKDDQLLAQSVKTENNSTNLYKIFILLVVLLLISEALVLRYMK